MPVLTSVRSGQFCSSSSTSGGSAVDFPAVTVPSGGTITGWYFTATVDRKGGYANIWNYMGNKILLKLGTGSSATYASAAAPETDLDLCRMTATGGTPRLRFGSGTSGKSPVWTDGTLYFVYDEGKRSVKGTVSPAGGGTLTISCGSSAAPGSTVTLSPTPAAGYHFSSWITSPAVTIVNNKFTMPSSAITITAVFAKTNYSVTSAVSPAGGGSLAVSKASAQMGDKITLTPSAAAGYQFSNYLIAPTVSIANNKFTMPASNVTVTAVFTKINYSLSKTVSPAGAGTFNLSATSAQFGTAITISGTSATDGYVFDRFETNPAATVANNRFTMPIGNTTVTAYFDKLTTGTIDSINLTPGVDTTVRLTPGSSAFTHQVIMSFGSYSKTWDMAAGETMVTVSPEISWCYGCPNAELMTGGTIIVKTLKNGSVIGQRTISTYLVFNVPASVFPSASLALSVLRTIDGRTYPSVGDVYVQNKCGVTAVLRSIAGAYGSEIVATEITVAGYADYIAAGEDDADLTLNSGLLTAAGTLRVTARVTDTRGRNTVITNEQEVLAYSEPSASLRAWRCDEDGEPDENGTYARYEVNISWSAVGSNSITRQLSVDGHSITLDEDAKTDWVLGNTHYTYPIIEAHDLYLTITDAFITKMVSVTIPSQRFMIHFSADGTSVAIGQTASTGSHRFTLASDMTMYIGPMTLEEYIHHVMDD